MRTHRHRTAGRPRPAAPTLLLLALALWLSHAEARAQWATDAANNISNSNPGHVGVGTNGAPPQAPLTVRSDTSGMPLLVHGANPNALSFAVRNDHAGSKGWAFQVAGPGHTDQVPNGSFVIRQASDDFNTLVVSPAGRVGVGALAPLSQFHVHNPLGPGALRVSGNGAGVMNFQDADAAADARLFQWRSEGGLFRLALANDAETGFVRQNLLVATAGGNVGLGTASPARALSLYGAAAPALGIGAGGAERATFGVATGAGQWFGATAANDTALRSEASDLWVGTYSGSRSIRFVTNDAQRLVVSGAGNVGVGTPSPAFRLDVAGQVRSSSGGFVFPDGTVQASAAAGTVTGVTAGSGLSGGGAGGAVTLSNSDPGSAQHIFKGVANGAGAVQFTAGANNDALRIEGAGGTSVTFEAATKKVVINSAAASAGWTDGGATVSVTNAAARVGIGGAPSASDKLHVEGDVKVTGTVRGGVIEASYQDVAEWVPSRQRLSAGTVVVLDTGRTNHVEASGSAYDTRVAGVVSARPGVILGEGGEGKLMVATTGRVRVRVDARRAPVRVGDLLVTGEAEGVAMRSEAVEVGGVALHRPGTIIGKALEPLAQGVGEILVLLSLQ